MIDIASLVHNCAKNEKTKFNDFLNGKKVAIIMTEI